MAIAMLVDNPEGSQETYDRVRERLGLDRPAGGSSTSLVPARTAAGE